MFHKTNFPNARNLEKFADADGFVPEVGDRFEDFSWHHLSDEDEAYLREEWQDYCNRADAETRDAEAEIARFRS